MLVEVLERNFDYTNELIANKDPKNFPAEKFALIA